MTATQNADTTPKMRVALYVTRDDRERFAQSWPDTPTNRKVADIVAFSICCDRPDVQTVRVTTEQASAGRR